MTRIGRTLWHGLYATGVAALVAAAPAAALPILDPDLVIEKEEPKTLLLDAAGVPAEHGDDLTSQSYAFFGELKPGGEPTLDAALERAAKQASLRDIVRTYVNNNQPGKAGARPAASLAPAGDPDDEWTGENLGVSDVILNSEALGGLARALVGEGEGEPGYRTFALLGYEVSVGVSSGATIGVYELTTNTGFSYSGGDPSTAVGGGRSNSRSSDAQMLAAVLDFFQGTLGISLLILLGGFVLLRVAVKIAISLQHVRS